jgi:alkylhydroperoxidase family enzyme
MSYIKEIEPADAQGDLAEIYGKLMEARGGRLPPVMKVLGLKPGLLRQVEALNAVVSFGGSSLGRRKEEMLATLVSSRNGCHY